MGDARLPAHINQMAWNRKILNVFWLVVVISVCVEGLNSLITSRSLKEFYIDYILTPTVLLTLVMLLAEIGYRKSGKYTDYVIIGSASLIAGILIFVHNEMEVMYSTLFFPLLISTTYFEKKKVWFSSVLSMVIYLSLTTFHPVISSLNDFIDRLSMFCILITCTFVCIGIMGRGYELAKNLKKAQADHLDLMVKSTIMEKQVKTDALTGLYNHMAFYEYLDVLILQADTYHYAMHLAIIDIDNFKKINDTYGHSIGDVVLKRIAQCLKENVSHDDFVARYGGEEFVVILNDVDEEKALQIMENVRAVVMNQQHHQIDDKCVTVSIGLQTYQSGMHKQAFFEGADSNLYIAKGTGKNKVVTSASSSVDLMEV